MEGPISFWGYMEQESNLIRPEHDDDEVSIFIFLAPNREPHWVISKIVDISKKSEWQINTKVWNSQYVME